MTVHRAPDPARQRAHMVEHDLRARGITDETVLAAMGELPRERFIGAHLAHLAYDDCALPIEADQTISQPFIVALMTEALELRPDDRVLEIGTGSGYAAAVLGRIAGTVWTVERHRVLAESAAAHLHGLGVDNVHVVVGDGTLGWPDEAPYDAIVVTAGGPTVPKALLYQLDEGGRLVMPVGEWGSQELTRVRRSGANLVHEDLGPVRFVPLVGAQGWDEVDPAATYPLAR